jgi:serine phosphatase RsbU (regulator of sigma subunit)
VNLRTRVTWTLIVTILVVILGGATLIREFVATSGRQAEVIDHIEPAAESVRALVAADAAAAESLARYVTTAGTDEKQQGLDALAQSAAELDRLEGLLANDQPLTAALTQLRSNHTTWVSGDITPIMTAMADGKEKKAVRLLDAPEWATRYDALVASSTAMVEAIDSRREQARAELRGTTTSLGIALLSMSLLALGLCAFIFIAMRDWVLRPLVELRADLRQAANAPEHDHAIRTVGPPEIAHVATDAEALRRELLRGLDAALAARASMLDDAPVVTAIELAMAPPGQLTAPGLSIHGTTRPAAGVIAGDWWDAVIRPDGNLGFVVADVSGHGVEAGITAISTRSVFRAGLAADMAPDEVLALASTTLTGGPGFVTAFIGVIDTRSRRLTWANAGHPAALIVTADKELRTCEPTGPLLSSLGGSWSTSETPFATGDVVLTFTDGLIESTDESGVELGAAALAQYVRAVDAPVRMDAPELTERVLARARQRATTWSHDDVTLLTIAGVGV